ncbi:hypothetical protein HZA98_02555 [Candidatus Woesearchaeota archaeon]|nr:hypothetical protein [Candidatus Woesearchaeota archaeon]
MVKGGKVRRDYRGFIFFASVLLFLLLLFVVFFAADSYFSSRSSLDDSLLASQTEDQAEATVTLTIINSSEGG